MALFGFNKQKVLANAEKYVQQGKLQNAIAEYEKVLKNDPKDLTVTNTIGDLYSRIGESAAGHRSMLRSARPDERSPSALREGH